MAFKQLIELYKKGEASDKEKKIIEDEIEKFEAVSDYVYSEKETSESIAAESDDFSKEIRKQIHRYFIKMGFIILAIVLTIFLLVQFALSPIVSSFYYDPTERIIVSEEDFEGGSLIVDSQKIEMDFEIFATLRMPLENRTFATATSLGYGKYNISITNSWASSYDVPKPSVSGQLTRNKLTLSIPDFIYGSTAAGKFAYSDKINTVEIDDAGRRIELQNEIKNYSDDSRVKVNISFENPLTYKEMLALEEQYEIEQAWYAVVTFDEPDNGVMYDLGFSSAVTDQFDAYETSEYPNLFIDSTDDGSSNGDYIKQHFLSMLKYMNDNKEFMNITEGSRTELADFNENLYSDAHKYVEKHGLKIYGCSAYVNKKSLTEMLENNDAYVIENIDTAKL